MTNSSTCLAGLIEKRAELAGEIDAAQARLDQMRSEVVHLDAAIRLLAPESYPELIPPKKPSRKGCDWFGRGELGRLVLDVLRDAQEPLPTQDVAWAVMERRGMPAGDLVALRRIENMTKGALRRREGVTTQRVTDGSGATGWRWLSSAPVDFPVLPGTLRVIGGF
jgi:hypothetical protein